MWGHALDRNRSGYRQLAGTCGCGDELSDSIKRGEYLDYLKPVNFSRRTLLIGVNYSSNYIRDFACFRKSNISFVIAVRPYTWNNSAPTRRKKEPIIEIFTKKYVETSCFARF